MLFSENCPICNKKLQILTGPNNKFIRCKINREKKSKGHVFEVNYGPAYDADVNFKCNFLGV